MKLRSLVRLFAAALVFSSTAVAVTAPAAHAAGPPLLGGGSGFAALEIDQWRADTSRAPYNLQLNYVAQGSTFGRVQFSGGQFDYGASDIQYIPAEVPDLQNGNRCHGRPIGQCMVYVPVSAGGLAFMYNLRDNSGNRITDLRLTRDAVCKIFTGAIKTWNDPAIVALNRKLASNSQKIGAVVRDDGAGESYVFSQYCMAIDKPVWSAFVNQQTHSSNTDLDEEFKAGRPTSKWPTNSWAEGSRPIPVTGADNMANYIADPTSGPNTMGYVAAGYAKVRNFPTASVENGVHAFTQPDEDNVTRALAFASPVGNGTFNLSYNGPDPLAYFPSTYSYILAPTTGFDPAKGAVLGTFICYAVSGRGQSIAPRLRYARLSVAIGQIALDAMSRIPGAPPKSNCPLGDYLGIELHGGTGGTLGGGGGGSGANGGGSGANGGGSGSGGGSNGGSNGSNGGAVSARVSAQQKAAIAASKKAEAAARQQAAADAKVEAAAKAGDAALQNTPVVATSKSKGGISLIWILAAGAIAAWLITFVVERRRAAA